MSGEGATAAQGLPVGDDADRLVVLILNWNSTADLQRCVESVDSDGEFELLVVDNDSSASERQRLHLLSLDHGFTVLQSSSNLGYAGGMNLGMRWARAQGFTHALLLNPDTLPTLPLVRGLWAQRHRATVVGVPQTADMVGSGSPEDAYTCAAYMSGPKLTPFDCRGCDRGFHSVDIATGACLLVDLAGAAAVDFFDESYFHYKEEVDFCVRVRRQGLQVGLWCGGGLLRHRRGGSLTTTSPLATYYSFRNELLFTRKLFGWPALLRMRRLPFDAARAVLRHPFSADARAVRFALVDGLRMVDGPSRRPGLSR